MLSSKISNISHLLKSNALSHSLNFNLLSTSSTILNIINRNDAEDEEDEKKLKAWRQPFHRHSNKKQKVYDRDDGFFGIFRIQVPFTPWGFKEYRQIKKIEDDINNQKLDKERVQFLGNELSAAYFLINKGGKVKFKGQNEWLSMNTDKIEEILPRIIDVNYIIEEIDASDIRLFYEGLENFQKTSRIKRAIFKNSPYFDDWFLDKISTIFPRLEYLDVSNCLRLTERGLEGLYRSANLKKLIITNYRKSAAFELTCLMLEDCLPKLEIEILEPPNQNLVNKS